MSDRPNPTPIVFVDADNTLWDTDRVFAEAQLALLDAVEQATALNAPATDRLAFVRSLDQGLAERHHEGLRYPPKLLIRALAAVLAGEKGPRAVRAALSGSGEERLHLEVSAAIEQAFFTALRQPPMLREGVAAGLAALSKAKATVLIITEGARARIERTTAGFGLTDHVTRIVEGAKRPDLYRRVLRLTNGADAAFMIGDQLDRDIAPAKAAGVETIYFPGGFQPRWLPGIDTVGPDHVIASFDEVPGIVLRGRLQGRAAAA